MDEKIFKAYDIRGIYPGEINAEGVYKIAQAYAIFLQPKKVALGRDVRLSSPELHQAACQGLIDAGVDVVDIGEVSTDMMYFAVAFYNLDGGLTITASHNPREYNGIKMVREKAIPISGDSGIYEIKDLALSGHNKKSKNQGSLEKKDILEDYVKHCLSFIDIKKIKKFSVVANANFGLAGQVLDKIKETARLPIDIIPLNYNPDGSFPKGRPDPLIPENRIETEELIKASKADFGVAWDADADRCFFFDEKGEFIDGYFIVALLAKIMLRGISGEKVIIDPRMVFATKEAVLSSGGIPLVNKVGHTFIKERMRKENAIFAGENSAHLYFRDNYYCDNGMIPFLLILQELSVSGQKLSELVAEWRDRIFVSGEINFKVKNPEKILAYLAEKYSDGKKDDTDGLSIEYDDWRFNVRLSNTEPLLRLNIESYSQQRLNEAKKEIENIIEKIG